MSEMDLRPDPETLRFYEEDGHKLRLFLTVGGAIACERYSEESDSWTHVPLRKANESEINEILAVRYQSDDEQIARTLASYR